MKKQREVQGSWHLQIEFLEQGDIFFFYKAKKGVEKVASLEEVQRFYLVLAPFGQAHRFLVLGKKQMPKITNGGKAGWGFVEKVGGRGFSVERSKEGKKRVSAMGARPAGEGIYSIVRHYDHTHFVYTLELPKRIGPVQRAFQIGRKGSYIFTIENPLFTKAGKQGLKPDKKRAVSKFIPIRSAELLNREGAELLMIGAKKDYRQLGISASAEEEDRVSADIFNRLAVDEGRHPTGPLFKGVWE